MKKMIWIVLAGLGAVAVIWVVVSSIINRVKEPSFTVVQSSKDGSVRLYDANIVAEVRVSGERRTAANEGFRLIANYIFGGNRPRDGKTDGQKIAMTAPVIQQKDDRAGEKIAMTAPVIQQKDDKAGEKIAMTAPVIQQKDDKAGEKIAMTAPVIQETGGTGTWVVQFVMPADYTMATLPVPNNPAVVLKTMPAKKFAVVRFSGLWSEQNIARHLAQLQTYVADNHLQTIGVARTAFYNAPWTPPFLRRNEIMIEVK